MAQQPPSLAASPIHQAERPSAALDPSDVIDHLLHHQLGDGLGRDGRRDDYTRMVPEVVPGRKRLALEHIEHCPAQLAIVERSEQVALIQVSPARKVDDTRAVRKSAE